MNSPLDTIEGSYSSAVFTTYSLNLRFFEHWVLPLLHAAGARNVVMLVDEAQLGAALDDHGLRSVGRSYHLVSTRLGPGAFHPKLILLHGEEGTRACVSSANLTVDGQLRNVEGGIVLDSRQPGHLVALDVAASFVRRIAADAPAHTVDALIAALPAAADPDALQPPTLELIHNLDEPLLNAFPKSSFTATAPYSDAGAAARALAELGPLQVITDGDAFAAPATFFAGSWTILPRRFLPRRLHAKAYAGDQWLLIGSPNLSTPALLQTASSGNVELAVIVTGDQTAFLDALPGRGWEDRPLSELAPLRHRQEQLAEAEQARVGSFNAWEDEGEIVLAGISDLPLEQWNPETGAWEPLGQPVNGRLAPPAGTRPHLIRCTEASGRVRQAIVHRTRLLRSQREQPKAVTRGAQALSKLPLDLQGIKALEDVLHDLYALESLRAEASEAPSVRTVDAEAGEPEPWGNTLTNWRPAREDDEPRIPELYRSAWQGEPDTLLALIRKALRLGEPEHPEPDDVLLAEEKTQGEEGDDEPENEPGEIEPTDATTPEPVQTTASVVKRYRGALLKLLERGIAFVRDAESPALADLALIGILRLHEELAQTQVTVDDEPQALIDASALVDQKVALLDAYLRARDGRDPSCLATARAHIGLCLKAREQLSPLAWETLERIAHQRGADLVADNSYAERAAQDAAIELGDLDLLIRPYAERADWTGFIVYAENELDDVDCGETPFPWVSGTGWFTSTTVSPAWPVVGYGAVAGFQQQTSYGVHARNTKVRTPTAAHAVVVDPIHGRIHEAFKRSSDGQWLMRTYAPTSQGRVEKTGNMGPDSILEDATRSQYMELDRAPNASDVISLLAAVGEITAAPAT
ncbi:MAG: hypothetical protein QOH16_2940 [Gaiellaceae bacterium]|nr:hypothetical protein [Gaiellaceae bacterium]